MSPSQIRLMFGIRKQYVYATIKLRPEVAHNENAPGDRPAWKIDPSLFYPAYLELRRAGALRGDTTAGERVERKQQITVPSGSRSLID